MSDAIVVGLVLVLGRFAFQTVLRVDEVEGVGNQFVCRGTLTLCNAFLVPLSAGLLGRVLECDLAHAFDLDDGYISAMMVVIGFALLFLGFAFLDSEHRMRREIEQRMA